MHTSQQAGLLQEQEGQPSSTRHEQSAVLHVCIKESSHDLVFNLLTVADLMISALYMCSMKIERMGEKLNISIYCIPQRTSGKQN